MQVASAEIIPPGEKMELKANTKLALRYTKVSERQVLTNEIGFELT